MSLPTFVYDFQSGPVQAREEIEAPLSKGNCRLAIQVYYHNVHGIWLEPEQVLCPELYLSTGSFVQQGELVDVCSLKEGDILLAERIRHKDGRSIDKSRSTFPTEEDWIISLHSAVLKSASPRKEDIGIWHATAIAGGTCEWNWSEFETYYRIVAVKRIMA